jgi:spermidine/putrescine transport system substrate-binding protein
VADSRDPRQVGRPFSRRDFLRRSAGGALALTSAGALLEACVKAPSVNDAGPTGGGGGSSASPAFPLAREDNPVTWPIFDDNPPIDSGLQPESGATLKVYNWEEYIWKKVTKDFGQKYDCTVEVSTFANVDEAIQKLQTGQADFDVYFPDPSLVGKLVHAKLLRPLNLSYIPNLSNVWPNLQDPFYDLGSRYTVPYTLYTTGIGWRNDKVTDDIAGMTNPYEIYWDPTYKGKTYLFDDYREPLAMALIKNGVTDINTEDPALIDKAKSDLIAQADAVNVKYDNSDFTDIPEGTSWIHQAWSGSLVSAQYYLPQGVPVDVLSYWKPEQGGGVIASDNIAVLKGGKNPVLAHLFLNYMLDNKVAFDNFYNFNGYQPPMNDINPDRMVSEGVVPANLANTILRPEDYDHNYFLLELSPSGDALWHSAWTQINAGA